MARTRQRKWLNIALGVALAGLGVGAWLAQEKPAAKTLLTTLTQDAIQRIVLRHPGKLDIVLEKQGNAWRLTAPVSAATDPFQVNGILSLAQQETTAQYPAAEMALADIGLAPPQYSVQLNDTLLEIGDTDPLEYRRYVKLGDQVYLTADPPSTGLDADFSDLVNPALIPQDVKLVSVQTPQITMTAKDGGGWAVTPATADKGADAAQGLADAWRNARSLWRALKTPADQPVAGDTVSVKLGDGSEQRFAVIARQPQLKLLRADLGVVYTLAPTLGDELFKLLPPSPSDSAAETKPAGGAPVPDLMPDEIAPEPVKP